MDSAAAGFLVKGWGLKFDWEDVPRNVKAVENVFKFRNVPLVSGSQPVPMQWTCAAPLQQHGSMAYGIDWLASSTNTGEVAPADDLCASCSFYDCGLHVWTVPTDPSDPDTTDIDQLPPST